MRPDEDPQKYERDCLAEVETVFRELNGAQMMREPGNRLLGAIELSGEYPATAIVVNYTDLASGEPGTLEFPLWNNPLFLPDGVHQGSPESVASLIYSNSIP